MSIELLVASSSSLALDFKVSQTILQCPPAMRQATFTGRWHIISARAASTRDSFPLLVAGGHSSRSRISWTRMTERHPGHLSHAGDRPTCTKKGLLRLLEPRSFDPFPLSSQPGKTRPKLHLQKLKFSLCTADYIAAPPSTYPAEASFTPLSKIFSQRYSAF